MKIATACSRTSRRWKNEEITWDALLERLRTPKRTGETMREYRNMSKDAQSARKDVGGFVGGTLRGKQRRKGEVLERYLITLDADEANIADWDTFTCLYEYRCAVYSTHSHTPEAPRLRWLIPLKRPVTPEEYVAVARKVASWIGIETMDASTYQPERLMYYPSCSEDAEYFFRHKDGITLDPDTVLHSYGEGDAWRDASLWPISSRETEVVLREVARQADPTEKRGIIGAFCRLYDVEDAIAEFLPDVYSECEGMRGRYTYNAGSTAAGAVVYESGKYLFSNHATDPAGGQLLNAFDLVRVHKYGARDAGHEGQTDTTRLPSYTAMCEFAAELPEMRRHIAEERLATAAGEFGDMGNIADGFGEAAAQRGISASNAPLVSSADKGADPAPEENLSWADGLTVNRKTGEVDPTINNATLILRNDPMLRGVIARNLFTGRIVVQRDLPWRKREVNIESGDDAWRDSDDSNLFLYLESVWGFNGEAKARHAWSVIAEENAYHPVRRYLDGLEDVWDGEERLDTLFVRYMNAADTPYTRAVTRKWFTAAVARIYEPGRKFDNMLVLVSAQGAGKSRLAMILSRGWFTDSLDRVDGKEAYEAIRGKWIVELAELAATKKAEVETIKNFVSKQVDSYRPAYGRQVVDVPRQCVFYGSTNDAEFLKDRTGNRRFWPIGVQIINRGRLNGLEDEVDQLWAEARARYKAGETLWLDDDNIAEEAEEMQAFYTQEDETTNEIETYLDTLLPDNWDELSAESKRDFFLGNLIVDEEKCTLRRDEVCANEIKWELYGFDARRSSAKGNDQTSYHVNRSLCTLRGWEKLAKKKRLKDLGTQWVYRRAGTGVTHKHAKRYTRVNRDEFYGEVLDVLR